MTVISAQISLYPLGQQALGPAIDDAVRALQRPGLQVRVGEMSTLVWGEEEVLFAALRAAFDQGTARGAAVMTVTLSNACPLPGGPHDQA